MMAFTTIAIYKTAKDGCIKSLYLSIAVCSSSFSFCSSCSFLFNSSNSNLYFWSVSNFFARSSSMYGTNDSNRSFIYITQMRYKASSMAAPFMTTNLIPLLLGSHFFLWYVIHFTCELLFLMQQLSVYFDQVLLPDHLVIMRWWVHCTIATDRQLNLCWPIHCGCFVILHM